MILLCFKKFFGQRLELPLSHPGLDCIKSTVYWAFTVILKHMKQNIWIEFLLRLKKSPNQKYVGNWNQSSHELSFVDLLLGHKCLNHLGIQTYHTKTRKQLKANFYQKIANDWGANKVSASERFRCIGCWTFFTLIFPQSSF